jgi:7-cyano-7-deazaguanine tRNA-ribosyltransferase
MVSYAEFHALTAKRRRAMKEGLRAHLEVPDGVKIYLDNGAFQFHKHGLEVPRDKYKRFVASAKPDWYAIPQDYIPTPSMTEKEQRRCLSRTMQVNRAYSSDGYVPVIHASPLLEDYLAQFRADERLRRKRVVGLGGLVPNLLRTNGAVPYEEVLLGLRRVRRDLGSRQLHVFGLGGTATLHIAGVLGIDSLDSCGWRNRAARGIVQLPGRGDRSVVKKGSWRGRVPTDEEWGELASCRCPACQSTGIEGLKGDGLYGFCNRATHNLWTVLNEAEAVRQHMADKTYPQWFRKHLNNSIYLPLIERALATRNQRGA